VSVQALAAITLTVLRSVITDLLHRYHLTTTTHTTQRPQPELRASSSSSTAAAAAAQSTTTTTTASVQVMHVSPTHENEL